MFSNLFLKSFRILLMPFAVIYWGGIGLRNWLYDVKAIEGVSFGLPVICVGNLAVGGTGKSPMVEYLASLLRTRFKVAILSRGYKRKTRGYALANEHSTALEIGDEPMQFHLRFPDVAVAVCERRIEAIPQLMQDRPDIEVILLDDAFQHREIKAGLNILLTEFSNLFTRDFYLPTGDLRDLKSSYKRADIIVVTKCSPELTQMEKTRIISELKPLQHQRVFFTAIEYGQLYHITNNKTVELNNKTEVLLVTGIANPKPIKKLLEKTSGSYSMLHYPDHHIYTIDDLTEIRLKFETMTGKNKIILTTEKDAVRLLKFGSEMGNLPFYILPSRHRILFDESEQFHNLIINFIEKTARIKNN
jgi:tetraacyldisaccharide 4'-kinase